MTSEKEKNTLSALMNVDLHEQKSEVGPVVAIGDVLRIDTQWNKGTETKYGVVKGILDNPPQRRDGTFWSDVDVAVTVDHAVSPTGVHSSTVYPGGYDSEGKVRIIPAPQKELDRYRDARYGNRVVLLDQDIEVINASKLPKEVVFSYGTKPRRE